MAFLLIMMVAAGLWARAHGAQKGPKVMTKSMAKERVRELVDGIFQESAFSRERVFKRVS